MQTFRLFLESFLTEAKGAVGIQHIEHPSDRTFDGHQAAHHALSTLKSAAIGRATLTRKIDGSPSIGIQSKGGKVGVRYKGGKDYLQSTAEIERKHGDKPYMTRPLKAALAHAHKVLPHKDAEYQAEFMSTPETRTESEGKIRHTPNAAGITYSIDKNSAEGKKLAGSKVSLSFHTEMKGKSKKPTPITDLSGFRQHPDVHVVDHTVSKEERKLSPKDQKSVLGHLSRAEKLMKGHDYGHLAGHEPNLRTYVNSTVDSGERPSVEGYKSHVAKKWQKEIDKVKTEKTKAAKAATRDAALAHVDANKEAFHRTFQIHHHVQQATNALARSLNKTASGGYTHHIGDKETGPEGFVANGLKIVDREDFSKNLRARSAILKATPKASK